MPAEPKPQSYYTGLNEALLRAVPDDALRILEVGCAAGSLGAALKGLVPRRRVYGVELVPDVAARAAETLDRVFTIDVTAQDPPLEPGSIDLILFGDVLEHLVDPWDVLCRLRRLLAPGGQVLCSIPNLQHHSMLAALLTGDFQYTDAGLLDATHLRFFTASTIVKLLLDAGYEPERVATIEVPCPPELLAAARPLLDHLGLHPARTANYLGAYQYIVRGRPLDDAPAEGDETMGGETPLSVVTCVSDEAILRANLLASPCLARGSPHEVIAIRGCPTAADGLNAGLDRASHPLVVLAHQDVYLPRGWPARLARSYRRAEAMLGPIGVSGVYGVAEGDHGPMRVGRVVDRDYLRSEPTPLPAPVATLDELLLVLPRGTPLRFDPALGFHFYGADVCLAARAQGLHAAAIDAPCFHNSRNVDLPDAFFASASAFARKWADRLPIATPCALVDRDGSLRSF